MFRCNGAKGREYNVIKYAVAHDLVPSCLSHVGISNEAELPLFLANQLAEISRAVVK